MASDLFSTPEHALFRDFMVSLCVVTLLATYHSPSEVQKRLKEEHGVEAALQQIQFYDPTTAHGAAELAPPTDLEQLAEGIAAARRLLPLSRPPPAAVQGLDEEQAQAAED